MSVLNIQIDQTKKAFGALLLCATLLTQTACTDEEVLASIGAGAIIGGVIAVGAACAKSDDCTVDTSSSSCHGGYTTVCRDYSDYWGNHRRECTREWDSCRSYGGHHHLKGVDGSSDFFAANLASSAKKTAIKSQGEKILNPNNVAIAFRLKRDSAVKLISAVKSARTGDSNGLKALGLARADLERVADGKMPTDSGINAMAAKLDQSRENTTRMVRALIKGNAVAARK